MAVAGVIIGLLLLLCAAIWIYFSTANCVRTGRTINCTTD